MQLTHNGDKINTKVHILVDINSKRTFISLSLYLYPGGRNKKGSILTTQIHKIEPNAFTMRLMQFGFKNVKSVRKPFAHSDLDTVSENAIFF